MANRLRVKTDDTMDSSDWSEMCSIIDCLPSIGLTQGGANRGQRNADYMRDSRRANPIIARSPLPISIKLLGSGTTEVVACS